jgi:mRNA (guanine-N7-)-methyltransferase
MKIYKMENVTRIIKLNKDDELYVDAEQSYKQIYNTCISKGTETLEPEWLGGNPIQLDNNNLNSLFKIKDGKTDYNDYFLSTKANGLRFMLFSGNKNEIKSNDRAIYFVDSKLNFWYIKDLPSIPKELNAESFLIDGELLFWGNVLIKKNAKGQIEEFDIYQNEKGQNLVAFLTFDILFGPTAPGYKSDLKAKEKAQYNYQKKEERESFKYALGSHGGMVGFKSINRWPTTRRRNTLEEMFLNKESPLWKYVHINSTDTLPSTNFTILVSPFIKMDEIMKGKTSYELYREMIKILNESIKNQYFEVDINYKKTIRHIPDIETDGLIFNPAYGDYINGPWTLCNNKQYKWKPIEDLTIDFEIGDKLKENFYKAKVKSKGKTTDFYYEINDEKYQAIVTINDLLDEVISTDDIVECSYRNLDTKNKYMYFNITKKRYDKIDPNAYLTAESVLDAADINGTLKYMRNIITMNEKPNILDFVMIVKEKQGIDNENIIDIVSTFGKNRLMKCYVSKHPLELFKNYADKMIKLITARQKDTTGLTELELRLNLSTGYSKIQPAFTNSLVKALLTNSYTPVPIIKIFKKDTDDSKDSTRSVYALVGKYELFEETIRKKLIDTVKISDDIFKYNYDFVLSEEHKESEQITKGKMQYQYRYVIQHLSKYWRVDIIEYADGFELDRAKINYEQNPTTRIDIEYDPGHFLKDIKKWSKKDTDEKVKEFFKFTGLTELNDNTVIEYIKVLNSASPIVILKDLGLVLSKIFGVLDVSSPLYEHKENPKKEMTKEMTKEFSRSIFQNMKDFHNSVKFKLIYKTAKQLENPKLLDISAGRGGDIDKWNNSGIKYVHGIDPDSTDIEEAKQRLAKNSRIPKDYKYTFDVRTITDKNITFKESFDIVSCQFSLHYFFENKKMINNALKNISNALKIGGYFIGTTLIENRVKRLIINNKFPEKINIYEDADDENAYHMKLIDTSDNTYYKDLPEFYVDFEKFKELCSKYSLKFVEEVSFSKLYEKYPRKDLKDYELAVSSLYSTFVFEKEDDE